MYGPRTPEQRKIIWIVTILMFMELFDGTALNTALPQMARDFAVDVVKLKFAVTIYLFALGLFIPVSAYLVEKISIRKTLLVATSVFLLASCGCGLSQSESMIVFFRLLQGVGGAFMLPVSRLAIARIFGKDLVKAMASVTSISLLGPMLGPVLGGVITTYLGWRWIFFINIPLGLIALYLLRHSFPQLPRFPIKRFDIKGFILLLLGFGLVFIATDAQGQLYQLGITNVVLLILGCIFLATYLAYGFKTQHPLVNVTVLKTLNFRWLTLGNFAMRFGQGAFPFLIPVLLQEYFHMTAAHAGLFMFPFVVGTWSMKPLAVLIYQRYNYRTILIINSILVAALQSLFVIFVTHWQPIFFVIYALVCGAASCMQYTVANACMFLSLPDEAKSHGNAIYLSLTQLGGCFGVSIAVVSLVLFGHPNITNGYLAAPLVLTGTSLIGATIFARCKRELATT